MAQNTERRLNQGDTLKLHVSSIGDAYTDPNNEFDIELYSINGKYVLRFIQNEISKLKVLTTEKAKIVITKIEKWKKERCHGAKCGLSYSEVALKIGHWKRKYKSGFYYFDDIINDLFESH